MTVLATATENPGVQAAGRAEFRVELIRDWEQATARWSNVGPPTPFQDIRWLGSWYRAFAGVGEVEPLIAIVSDAVTGERAALLPLVRRLQNGIRIVEYADLDLTDYNAPLLGPAAPRDAGAADAMWRELKAALRRMPGGADLIRLRKMPHDLAGRPNPLALLNSAGPCSLNGNIVATGDDYDAWRVSLGRTVRKELERSWRVFTRNPDAGFKVVTDRNEALRILTVTEAQQGVRMQQLGLNFILNNDTCAAFYRNLIREGLGSGFVVISALTSGDEIVATLLGVRTGTRYVMVRISNAGEKWSNCSPGRLIIERTMAALHQDGVREVDFSIGNYAYKRRFGVEPVALADLTASLSWRGMPYALRDRAARALRNYPRLTAFIKRALAALPSRQ